MTLCQVRAFKGRGAKSCIGYVENLELDENWLNMVSRLYTSEDSFYLCFVANILRLILGWFSFIF